MMAQGLMTRLGLATAIILALFAFGCSGDDENNSTGPNNTPTQTLDEITVNLSSINVKYDCDFDPVGVSQPGDFQFSLNIDTLSDDGSKWLAASKNGTGSREINNGGSYSPSGQSASVRLPRLEGQAFRVRTYFREADPDGASDFKVSKSFEHVYHASSPQMYAPDGTAWTSYSNSTGRGTITQGVNVRDRKWALGVLVGEGCIASMTYSVVFKKVN
jgi:hypothetical protein